MVRPVGYWRVRENILAEARKAAIENGGKLPSTQQLQRTGYSCLVNGATSYYGGINNLRIMLGEKPDKVSNGYWDNWEIVSAELIQIANQLGHFPTQKELSSLGRNDISIAISKKHGGLLLARKRLGFSEKKEKPSGYWEDWNNFEREMGPVVERLGRLPNKRESKELGITSGYCAIYDYYGGATKVRKRLGMGRESRKTKGYWQDKKNVIKEIRKIMRARKLVEVPSLTELRVWGYNGLSSSISEYHGGFIKLITEMGYESRTKPSGYWQDFENVRKALEIIIEQFGHFPTQREIQQSGYHGLSNAIYKWYGGSLAVKERLGITGEGDLEKVLERYVGGKR
jgi:hypothetical protein